MTGKSEHLGWMKKGDDLMEWKQYQQALKAFEQAIKAKRNHAPAWKSKGMALMELEEFDRAVQCFDKFIKLTPESGEGWTLKANALEEMGDYPAVEACYAAARVAFPDEPTLGFFEGVYFNRTQQFDRAIESLSRMIEHSPDPLSLTARSHALEQTGQLELALDDLDRITIYGDFFMVQHSRGEVLEQLERYEEALEAYTRAVREEPSAAFLWRKKGDLLEKLERHDEALAWYTLSVNTIGYPGLQMKGQLLQLLNRHEEALVAFQQVAELAPQEAQSYYDQAVCCYQLADIAGTITALQSAIAQQPETMRDLLKNDPLFRSQLNQPEFQALLTT
jgi:tetratricopeptide (TPR) repeat protein